MSRKYTLFDTPKSIGVMEGGALSCIPSVVVPTIIEAIERRKYRSFWPSDEDFDRAYNALSEAQWGLLMDCSEPIRREIRAMRDGDDTNAFERDMTVDPFELTSASLRDLQLNTQDGGTRLINVEIDTLFAIRELRDAVQSQSEDIALMREIIFGLIV